MGFGSEAWYDIKHMSLYNKILARVYFTLSLGFFIFALVYFFKYGIYDAAVFFSIGVVACFIFGIIHRNISNNILGIFREKSMAVCSSANVLLIFYAIVASFVYKDESAFYALFFLTIASFFTLLFGVTTVFKINKKILFWVIFSMITLIIFLSLMDS